jgi:predicted dehydrogenase
MSAKKKPSRRGFLGTAAVAGTALTLTAKSYAQVPGANGDLRVGFIGVGGRCQQHIDVILKMQTEKKGVRPVGACDVWDGDQTKSGGKGAGLYPSAKRCGLDEGDKKHVTKDYRILLEQKDVDLVAIASPDHWHARQTIDAMEAGKHVYCEKPMTRTIAEAQAVVDSWKKTKRVMSVGVQSMADPIWAKAHEYITAGKIGHVLQAQTRYYRNSTVGQWRYYNLTKSMTPTTVDWDMFLGHQFDVGGVKVGPTPKEQPFDRAVFHQWRCYWPFGGGMFTDLFVHQVTHLIRAMGVTYPKRVVGGGGVYFEYDTRDVPDVAMVCADYDEGCQMFVTASMVNDYPIDECIRGKTGTIKFIPQKGDLMAGFELIPQTTGQARGPGDAGKDKGELITVDTDPKTDLTYDLWVNYLDCVRKGEQGTLSTPELGAAAFTTVNMGVLSYRNDEVLYWDKEGRTPVKGDGTWAKNWEKRSKERGKPNQVQGWKAGDTGSTLQLNDREKEYMKLAGPWIDGKDPADAK